MRPTLPELPLSLLGPTPAPPAVYKVGHPGDDDQAEYQANNNDGDLAPFFPGLFDLVQSPCWGWFGRGGGRGDGGTFGGWCWTSSGNHVVGIGYFLGGVIVDIAEMDIKWSCVETLPGSGFSPRFKSKVRYYLKFIVSAIPIIALPHQLSLWFPLPVPNRHLSPSPQVANLTLGRCWLLYPLRILLLISYSSLRRLCPLVTLLKAMQQAIQTARAASPNNVHPMAAPILILWPVLVLGGSGGSWSCVGFGLFGGCTCPPSPPVGGSPSCLF